MAHGEAGEASVGLGELLIPAINRLQDVFSQAQLDFTLDLPQVAVVGSQSAGKSSVLEALVGRDFLPRGPDICTRRPLVLQLVKHRPRSGQPEEYGEFLHIPGQRFTDFSAIWAEIEAETQRVTGSNRGVSDRPIRLRVFSPHVLTMTLVDLPGVTRVPVGDQPSDIEERLREMIMNFIRHPSCLILAVSQANVDLANSDALQMARAVDPDGQRTIGVLTKLDLMDRGTDAVAALANRVVPLRLGYVGVVNRSQHDIQSGKSMPQALADADAWFASRPEYREVGDRCGVRALSRTISHILVQHIHSVLPQLKRHVEGTLARKSKELLGYGEPAGATAASRGGLLLKTISEYDGRFKAMLDGRSEDLPVSELAGGARIRHIFQDIFNGALDEYDPSRDLTDAEIRTAIKNSGGIKGSLMIPEAPFEILVRASIRKLLPPALQCSHLVHQELLRVAAACQSDALERFPLLQKELDAAVADLVSQGTGPCEKMIRDLVDCELALINTAHPAFIGGARAVTAVVDRRRGGGGVTAHRVSASGGVLTRASVMAGVAAAHAAAHAGRRADDLTNPANPTTSASSSPRVVLHTPGSNRAHASPRTSDATPIDAATPAQPRVGFASVLDPPPTPGSLLRPPPPVLVVDDGPSEQDGIEVEVTRMLVDSYFRIVRSTLQDMVPKVVMQFLVGNITRELHQHLVQTLYREERLEALLSESPDVLRRRQKCHEAVSALTQALAALEGIPRDLQKRLSVSRSMAIAAGAMPAGTIPAGVSQHAHTYPHPQMHPHAHAYPQPHAAGAAHPHAAQQGVTRAIARQPSPPGGRRRNAARGAGDGAEEVAEVVVAGGSPLRRGQEGADAGAVAGGAFRGLENVGRALRQAGRGGAKGERMEDAAGVPGALRN